MRLHLNQDSVDERTSVYAYFPSTAKHFRPTIRTPAAAVKTTYSQDVWQLQYPSTGTASANVE